MSREERKGVMKCLLSKVSFGRLFRGTSLRDAIEAIIVEDDSSDAQSIAKNEREILGNVLNLREVQVRDIMVQRIEIESIPVNARLEHTIAKFIESQKSSIVVYQGVIDNVVGVVYIKDLVNWFYVDKPFNISMFVKKVLFIPPTMKSIDLLFKMRETGIKTAIVVDEYGGVDGLVSFRDVIEEIIGDIQDVAEVKNQRKRVMKSADGFVIADARSTFSELQKYGGIRIVPDDKSIDTIGGAIASLIGRVPVRGELVMCQKQKLEFEILDADPRRVKSVKIRQVA
ncbi:MAG: CBS domain-containing protein [Holosporales bacterium]|jgi:CBS domain containing-hemolysin-like protein|nr:CBS domain-containing protein [Holosporales bacterium]